MKFLKIVGLSVLAAILYGMVHDQITIRICPEYFTVFHPKIMETGNLTLIALGWGVLATWWMGAGIGLALALSARWGSWPKQTATQLLPWVAGLLVLMGICAVAGGILGYFNGPIPAYMAMVLPITIHQRFAADWWAHQMSYASGFFSGIGLCALTLVRRFRAI